MRIFTPLLLFFLCQLIVTPVSYAKSHTLAPVPYASLMPSLLWLHKKIETKANKTKDETPKTVLLEAPQNLVISNKTSQLVELDQIQPIFSETLFYNLDYGLYWADENHRFYSAQHLLSQDVYNPYAPTVIYIHGWQRGATQKRKREMLFTKAWQNYAQEVDIIRIWRAKGYNVGVLYWTQFADELEVKDAEAKIWSNQGNKGMRWRDADGEFHTHTVSENVVELLLSFYTDALRDYQGPNIRFAGHSLGSQVAISLAYRLHKHAQKSENRHFERLIPKRIALLDPFFSRGAKAYLKGSTVGEHTTALVRELIQERDVLFESYRSTWPALLNFIGDANFTLLDQTAHLEYYPDFVSITDFFTRHKICLWIYGLSMDKVPPRLMDSDKVGLSASTSDDMVKKWMNSSEMLRQNVHLENITENKDTLGNTCAVAGVTSGC